VNAVVEILHRNVEYGRDVVRELARSGLPACTSDCAGALDGAIITDPSRLTEEHHQRIALLTGTTA
jgi:hypothetical protein